MARDVHLLGLLFGQPWAILPDKLALIETVALRHVAGERLDRAEIEAVVAAAQRPAVAPRTGAVAVLPIVGTLAHRADFVMESSGGASTQRIGQQFRALMADDTVGSIVLDIDSPGGQVDGTPELADLIYSARGHKPVVAVANTLAASAAYWIGSQADEFVASPSAAVGSIGVLTVHDDISKAAEMEGVKRTYISAGKYKAELNPFEPLSDEARSALQARVDGHYAEFVAAVARGRGVKAADVRGGFGEGRVVSAYGALTLGMVDRVETLDSVIARLARGGRPGGGARAEPATGEGLSDVDMRRRRLRRKATAV